MSISASARAGCQLVVWYSWRSIRSVRMSATAKPHHDSILTPTAQRDPSIEVSDPLHRRLAPDIRTPQEHLHPARLQQLGRAVQHTPVVMRPALPCPLVLLGDVEAGAFVPREAGSYAHGRASRHACRVRTVIGSTYSDAIRAEDLSSSASDSVSVVTVVPAGSATISDSRLCASVMITAKSTVIPRHSAARRAEARLLRSVASCAVPPVHGTHPPHAMPSYAQVWR